MTGTASPGPTSEQVHILVVDDDPTLGEALCRVLNRQGYVTTAATGFRAALEILESERRIDLLLVDIVMPDGVNGLALSRMARLRRRELKVLYMTGYSIPGIEREALGPILHKPVDDQVLFEEITRLLLP
ncbi:MAG TPA: response regulator [Acetobacteraceae bacterium]|nr:response regulator [Acetobacteraceae bacterium]